MKQISTSNLAKKFAGIDTCRRCEAVYIVTVEDLAISIGFGHDMNTGIDTQHESVEWKCEVCDSRNVGSKEIQGRIADVHLLLHMQEKAKQRAAEADLVTQTTSKTGDF